jgi:hypothetical protein
MSYCATQVLPFFDHALARGVIVQEWFRDAIHILGRQYSPIGPFDQLPERDDMYSNNSSIIACMHRVHI